VDAPLLERDAELAVITDALDRARNAARARPAGCPAGRRCLLKRLRDLGVTAVPRRPGRLGLE
jgi:hypothetical protein